ncbi:GNAT family N-acetyltransferase [Natronococcus pandeyae]|uniref:GNAT family N-acetyltransferase n=1 Tax=Natronococcus pandeyae TaxID=2055836 RepID=A0A8J8Q142_9EURY|nr:GNAT family N-acetyltransferase [Natronococcus pandeyae]TYL37047.1 GNAT family N-acetyltransferase [Natronococcus pandeyae]
MVDYRPIPDEREAFHEYRSYAFRPEEGLPPYDPDEHENPRATRGARRAIYADTDADAAGDERPRTVCRHYWLEARVRGDVHPTAGLASVATPPEYRRSGYVRQLLTGSLAEYRDRGDRFSILWPFEYRFYRQYGWDTANRIVTHACEPSVLSFARGADADGSFRSLEADDYEVLEHAYDAATEGLALERDEAWWRHRVFGGHDIDPFVYAYERSGEVAGYLVYRIEDEDDGRTMRVSELTAADPEALLALLAFCADHDSQVGRIELRVSETVPIRDLARDPDEIETTITDGPMVRVVDVAETLPALSLPDVSTELTLAVEDPLADWNDGVFELEAANGRLACDRLDDSDVDSDATLEIGALSQLVVGTRSAADLERTGRLEARNSEVLAALESLFPETDVYFGEYF